MTKGRQWHPTPVPLPRKSHGRRSLVGCSPWGHKELDTTERLHFPFSLSCIGEGNGNPLQCPCLENPRDGGTLWAAISRVTQSPTRLKRLSSSRRAKSHFISAEMSLFETAVESPFAASTLVALRQVQGAEEESVLYGGKEEAGRGCLEQRSLQGNQSAA